MSDKFTHMETLVSTCMFQIPKFVGSPWEALEYFSWFTNPGKTK